jgi:alpha-glucosidase (family GH31 glycosyl hydrolase)
VFTPLISIIKKVATHVAISWVLWFGVSSAGIFSNAFAASVTVESSVVKKNFEFTADSRVLIIEVENDQTLHFEYLNQHPQLNEPLDPEISKKNDKIYSSPMVAKRDFSGPSHLNVHDNVIETDQFTLTVSLPSLCVTIFDRRISEDLLVVCAEDLEKENKALVMNPRGLHNIYGLGNYFYEPATADGDWSGKDWVAEGFGNVRHNYLGGAPSISQFPVLYALGNGFKNVAVFLDNPRQMSWNFKNPERWTIHTPAESLRFYIMTGPHLKSLRRQFMDLVGKPLVPPKNTFGLWVSKFGYGSWDEIKEELAGLRKSQFPIDGFALDLQWFGGRFDDPAVARMGSLSFDRVAFPSPEKEIARFREVDGIHFMTIEESYVDIRLPEYQSLKGCNASNCYLARMTYNACDPVQLGDEQKPMWWGRGGMIDWTHPEARRFWNQEKRLALEKMGIQHHWTDLGEPEMHDALAYYHGIEPGKTRHWDIHNLFSLMWLKGIHDGYEDAQNQEELKSSLGLDAAPRYFSMSRAGAPGLQRFGAGMWSGDIGRNAPSLRAQLNTQLHMSMAGVDYYNSDVGGFSPTGDAGIEPGHNDYELYTQWFANSALGEIPLRPHGWAYGQKGLSLAPNRQGDFQSNRANLLRRYELSPYLYSLAHRANRFGDPIFPPLVYEFQDDLKVRQIGNEKMIGDSLLFGAVVGFGQKTRQVYLPRGSWVNYDSHEWFESQGEDTPPVSLYPLREGKPVFTLPLFARAGAIIPKMIVDAQTLNLSGNNEGPLVIQVVSGTEPSSFIHYEDDGTTLAYRDGHLHSTQITQVLQKSSSSLTQLSELIHIAATLGDYAAAPQSRAIWIDLIVNQKQASSVSLNGQLLQTCLNQKDWDENLEGCWWNEKKNLIRVKSKSLDIRTVKDFQIDFL